MANSQRLLVVLALAVLLEGAFAGVKMNCIAGIWSGTETIPGGDASATKCLTVLHPMPLHVELDVPCGAKAAPAFSLEGTALFNFTEITDQQCRRGGTTGVLTVESRAVVKDLRAVEKRWACWLIRRVGVDKVTTTYAAGPRLRTIELLCSHSPSLEYPGGEGRPERRISGVVAA